MSAYAVNYWIFFSKPGNPSGAYGVDSNTRPLVKLREACVISSKPHVVVVNYWMAI